MTTTLDDLLIKLGVDADELDSGMDAGVRSVEEGFDRIERDADRAGKAIDDAGDRAAKAFDGVDPAAKQAGTALDRVAADADRAAREVEGAGDRSGAGFLSGMRGGLGGIGGVASSAMDRFKTVAMAGAAAAGLAIGAVVATSFASGLEVEKATDRLAASLALTEEQSAAFGRAAGNLYADAYGDSIGEVTLALDAVSSSLGDSLGAADDALESTTAKALDMAGIFGVDVVDAAGLAGFAVESGLAKDADHAFDLIVASMQRMPAGMRQELFPIIEEYADHLAGMGFTGEQAFGLVAAASEGGSFQIDKTVDAIKELSIRATDMSTASVEAFDAMGLNADDMAARFIAGGDSAAGALSELAQSLLDIEDPVERSNEAIKIFGTPLEDLSVTQIPKVLESLTTLGDGLGDVSGVADAAGDVFNDNAATKLEAFRRGALMNLTGFLGGHVIPALEKAGDWASNHLLPAFEGVGDWIASDGVDGLKDFAGWLGDELGPAAADFADTLQGDVLPAAEAVGGFLASTLVPAVQALGEFILGTAVPALVSFTGWLAEHERVLAAVAIAVGVLMLPALAALVVGFGAWAVSAGAAAAATLLAMAPIILIGAAIAAFAYLVITHWDTIRSTTEAVFGAVVGFIQGAFNWVTENWPALLAILLSPFTLAGAAIGAVLAGIRSAASGAKQWVVDRFNEVVSFVSGLPGRITSAAAGMWDGITGAFRSAINTIIRLWNGLSFPSVTVGGGDPLGSFGPSLPEVTIGGWELPNIPELEHGALVKATPGGTFANLGEGRFDEAVVPLPRGLRAMGQGMGQSPLIGQVTVQGSLVSERDLIRLLQDAIDQGDIRVPGGAFAA